MLFIHAHYFYDSLCMHNYFTFSVVYVTSFSLRADVCALRDDDTVGSSRHFRVRGVTVCRVPRQSANDLMVNLDSCGSFWVMR